MLEVETREPLCLMVSQNVGANAEFLRRALDIATIRKLQFISSRPSSVTPTFLDDDVPVIEGTEEHLAKHAFDFEKLIWKSPAAAWVVETFVVKAMWQWDDKLATYVIPTLHSFKLSLRSDGEVAPNRFESCLFEVIPRETVAEVMPGLPAAMGQYDDFLSSVPSTIIANQFSRAVALSGVQMMKHS